jgi:hypothetical protein
MSQALLALAMPGPVEMIILLVIAVIGIAFVFLLFRFLWRSGSRPVEGPPRREG